MNTTFQIQIKTHNWEGGSPTITKEQEHMLEV